MKKINLKSLITLLIAQFIIMLLITTSLADTATITVETARLRREASETSTVLELISQGEEIEVLGQEGDWYQVRYNQMVGYVRGDLLEISNSGTNNNSNTNGTNEQNSNTSNNNGNETNQTGNENSSQNEEGSNEGTSNQEEPSQNSSEQENPETSEGENAQNNGEENVNNQESAENGENAEGGENQGEEGQSANSTDNNEVQEAENNQENLLGTYKTKENIIVKILPLINSLNIEEIEANTDIQVNEIMNGWAYLTYQDISGWCRLDNLEKTEENESTGTNQETNAGNETENIEQTNTENTENAENTENSEENSSNQSEENLPINMTQTKYINSQTVNVRSGPSTTSSIVMQLKLNTEVQVLSEENSWYRIKVEDQEGYVASSLLSDTKQETSRGMETSRDFTSEVQENETEANEENQANNSANQSNNVNNGDTSNTTSAEPVNNVSSNKGEEVLAYAMQFKGSKYVYGGTSPSGFDCSGFTYYVYKHFGITLSRTAAGQYSSNGTSVSRSQLKAGDLVMFCNPVNHVGIYIGNGQMIHAANPSRGVVIDTINSGYYNTNYRGAKRIFN